MSLILYIFHEGRFLMIFDVVFHHVISSWWPLSSLITWMKWSKVIIASSFHWMMTRWWPHVVIDHVKWWRRCKISICRMSLSRSGVTLFLSEQNAWRSRLQFLFLLEVSWENGRYLNLWEVHFVPRTYYISIRDTLRTVPRTLSRKLVRWRALYITCCFFKTNFLRRVFSKCCWMEHSFRTYVHENQHYPGQLHLLGRFRPRSFVGWPWP
jgi:hypothetical protein